MIKSIRNSAWFGVLPLFVALASQNSANPAFGVWRRISETPILSPRGNGWESAGTFNPAVIERAGQIVMLYRAQDGKGTSRLGYGESSDGIRFTRRAEPVFVATEEYEKEGGVEDPRLVKFANT
jgi:predicted GH43/DUF377 family glycosyl hydrolase